MQKPELVAPAGNLEKLKIALTYGADAVYLGGERYGLRAFAGNFPPPDLERGIYLAHDQGKKVYVTVNILMRDDDLKELPGYLEWLDKSGVDGFIVSDLGAIDLMRVYAPRVPITLSTQASVMNSRAARVYRELGVSRIVAARELTLEEMARIRQEAGVEIETFVHGAMCISYSGRCLLSSYMTGRSGNRGECAHPCRYQYTLVEELRPGEYFPIEEDAHGTYVLNSKDLCLWEEVPALMTAGIDAFKIEGRMKSLHYVATVTRAYREAIDAWAAGEEPDGEFWLGELAKVATRPYTRGFLYGQPADAARDAVKTGPPVSAVYCGLVIGYEQAYRRALVEERAPFAVGDELEVFTPEGKRHRFRLDKLYGADRVSIERARHARELLWVPIDVPIPASSLLRRISK